MLRDALAGAVLSSPVLLFCGWWVGPGLLRTAFWCVAASTVLAVSLVLPRRSPRLKRNYVDIGNDSSTSSTSDAR